MPEQQLFPPSKEFSQRASVRSMAEYEALYQAAAKDPEKFWAEQAKRVHWFAPWTKVLDWSNTVVPSLVRLVLRSVARPSRS